MSFLSKSSGSTGKNLSPYSAGVQTKLNVGQPGDPAEKEADHVARQVVEGDKKEQAQKKVEDKKDNPGKKEKVQKSDEKKEAEKPKKPEEKKDSIAKKEDGKKQPEALQPKEMPKNDTKDDKKDKPAVQKAADTDKLSKKEEPAKSPEEKKEKPAKPAIQQKPEQKNQQVNARFVQPKEVDKKKKAENDDEALAALEEKIQASKGSGKPMETPVLQSMQRQFSQEFSSVRIHTDGNAVEMCTALHAQAFTHGNDIYFNSGKYQPDNEQGKELLAHELTHVVQQTQHVRRMVQRAGNGGEGGGTAEGSAPTGTIDTNTITIDKLKLPPFKSRNNSLFTNMTMSKRPEGLKQDEVWKAAVEPKVKAKVLEKTKNILPDDDTKCFYLGHAHNKKTRLIGTVDSITENSKVPGWDKSGKPTAYDVDHIKEMQLGGTNKPDENMELLNFSSNRSSGSRIEKEIKNTLKDFLTSEQTKKKYPDAPTQAKALSDYTIKFNTPDFTMDGIVGGGKDFYSYKEIQEGEHLEPFHELSQAEKEVAKGKPDDPNVFTSEGGGNMLKEADFKNMPGFSLEKFDFKNPTGGTAGNITGTIFKNSKLLKPYQLNLFAYPMAGVKYGGYIKRRISGEGSLEKILSRMEVFGLSPIEFTMADIIPGKGLIARGKIKPTVKILEGIDIDITIEGDNIQISKTFSAGEIKGIPPPFKINDAAITIFAGTNGIGIRGDIDFEINKLGKGKISGSGKSNGLFELSGKFEFDKKVFNRADIELKYIHTPEGDDKFEAKGTINIPANKIKGVKKADIIVAYADNTLTAKGTAEFDLPIVKKGQLEVIFTGDDFKITGDFDLEHKTLKSGKIHAEVTKLGDEYKVNVTGNAKPNVKGVDIDLNVSYVDGIIDITGNVAYAKGMLSGTVNLGVTNRPVTDGGAPGGGPTNNFSIYGGGQLTLKLTPWLQGTAGVQFKADGKMQVIGKIGIPGAINLFDKKEITKNIFHAPTIEIPLFAIPVGSHSIGIVATIGGGADAYANIGPGQLTEADVEVKYDPDAEDATTVTGNAKFRIPAEAGIRLYIRAGVGLSVGIASVTGGIELGGTLAITGAAEAGVQVNWSPTTGLKLDAAASISVQPKFKFDVTAYLQAKLDLWITEFTKEWRKTLASVEYGSAMTFGVKFPVHFEEGKPFDIALSDVEFEKPDIDVGAFAKGIGSQLFGS